MVKEKLFILLSKLPNYFSFFQLKWLKRLLITFSVLLALLWGGSFALFYFYFQPHMDDYKQQAEEWFHEETGGNLSIGQIDSKWTGFAPELTVHDIKIQGVFFEGKYLEFKSIMLKPSWYSLINLSPRFKYIGIDTPELTIVRNTQNKWLINGLLLNSEGSSQSSSSNKIVNILLKQREISINEANISYEDQYLSWPKIVLDNGVLRFQKNIFGNELVLKGELDKTGKYFESIVSWQGDDADQWREWSGKVDVNVVSPDKSSFSQYLGRFFNSANVEGTVKGSLTFSQGRLDDLKMIVNLTNAQITDNQNNQLTLPKVSAKTHIWQKGSLHYQFDVTEVDLVTSAGNSLKDGELKGELKLGDDGFGLLKMNQIELSALDPILKLIGAHENPIFEQIQLDGVVSNLEASWQGDTVNPHDIQVKSEFTDLGWKAFNLIPGVNKVSGSVNFDKNQGQLLLSGQEVALHLPTLYNEPITIDQIDGQFNVKLSEGALHLDVETLEVSNKDIKQVQANGRFTHYFGDNPKKLKDHLSVNATIAQADAKAVKLYLPKIMKPKSKEWLVHAFLGGNLKDISLKIDGTPKAFPFVKGEGGNFSVQSKIDQVELSFAPEWPTMKNINGSLQFLNENIVVNATGLSSDNLKINKAKIVIHNLKDRDDMWMDVDSDIGGSLPEFLSFAKKTPIVKWTSGFINEVQGNGSAGLALKLRMPLQHVRDAKVYANLKLTNSELTFTKTDAIPKLQNVTGVLGFTEEGLNAQGVKAQVYGGWVTMNAQVNKQKATQFHLNGRLDTQKLLSFYWSESPRLAQGVSAFNADFTIRKGLESLTLKSDMVGTKWLVPISSVQATPLNLQLKPNKGVGWEINTQLGVNNKMRINIHQGRLASAMLSFGSKVLPNVNPRGITVSLYEKNLDLNTLFAANNFGGSSSKKSNLTPNLPVNFQIASDNLKFLDYNYGQVNLRGALAQGHLLSVDVQSNKLSGRVKYDLSARNKLDIHLSSLYLQENESQQKPKANNINNSCTRVEKLPQANVSIDRFYLNNQNYGVLSFDGMPKNYGYQVGNLSLKQANAQLNGEMKFISQTKECARLTGTMSLTSKKFGQWLQQADLSKQIDGGVAKINLDFAFPSVDDLKLANLEGKVDLEIKNGRFVNAQPGLGRILGVFDISKLAKRLTLNFKDVFLPGLSFDSITSSGTIKKGILTADHLNMDAAGIVGKMNGRIDMPAKTLNMKLSVSSNLTHGVVSSMTEGFANSTEEILENDGEETVKMPRRRSLLTKNFHISGKWADPVIKRD